MLMLNERRLLQADSRSRWKVFLLKLQISGSGFGMRRSGVLVLLAI